MMVLNDVISFAGRARLPKLARSRIDTCSVKWAKTAAGEKVFPMHLADMEFLTAPAVAAAIKKRSEHGLYGYTYYPETMLDPYLSWVTFRYKWEINKKSVSVCHGVLQSVNTAINAFSEPGDGIIIQPPVYHPFYHLIRRNGRIVLENPLKNVNGRYCMDTRGLELLAKKAKLLILCNPHNPVGRVWKAEELDEAGYICLKNNVLIISDDIHCDFTYGLSYTPIASLSQAYAKNCVTCHSPSKTFNLAGLNSSVAVIQDPGLMRAFEKEKIRSGFGRINLFAVKAMEAAYRHGAGWLDGLTGYLKANINATLDIISSSKNISTCRPEGTYLMWLDFRKTGLKEADVQKRLIEKAGVLLEPGSIFGRGGRGFHRMNIACGRKQLLDYVGRIKAEFNAA